ncbi:DDE-type integrase/transposase/recombinase [Streptomyces pimonensis]|uniref:DDE-type integrase/transposase/recombinase n=1 Tax=Streptomyces pimonensis TaxID=2860288 RepID=A0ABV4IZK0_9ACTN
MADHHRAERVVDALGMAHGRGGPEPGRVIHSDRGSAYTSARFRPRVTESGLRQSCGRTGSCFDSAAAESFWVLSGEEIGTRTRTRPDRATARAGVLDFIGTFHNRRRLRKHKTFGCPAPAETRQRHQHTLTATVRPGASAQAYPARAAGTEPAEQPVGPTAVGPSTPSGRVAPPLPPCAETFQQGSGRTARGLRTGAARPSRPPGSPSSARPCGRTRRPPPAAGGRS